MHSFSAYLVLVPAQVIGLIAFIAIALGPVLAELLDRHSGGTMPHPAQELAIEETAAAADRDARDAYCASDDERRAWDLLSS